VVRRVDFLEGISMIRKNLAFTCECASHRTTKMWPKRKTKRQNLYLLGLDDFAHISLPRLGFELMTKGWSFTATSSQ
jgi:hypothetical protein